MTDKPNLTKQLVKDNFPIIYEATPECYEQIIDEFLFNYAPMDREEAKSIIREGITERFMESDEGWP